MPSESLELTGDLSGDGVFAIKDLVVGNSESCQGATLVAERQIVVQVNITAAGIDEYIVVVIIDQIARKQEFVADRQPPYRDHEVFRHVQIWQQLLLVLHQDIFGSL